MATQRGHPHFRRELDHAGGDLAIINAKNFSHFGCGSHRERLRGLVGECLLPLLLCRCFLGGQSFFASLVRLGVLDPALLFEYWVVLNSIVFVSLYFWVCLAIGFLLLKELLAIGLVVIFAVSLSMLYLCHCLLYTSDAADE